MLLAKLLEQVRLRVHFRQVLAELRARDVAELAAPERDQRQRLLVELARYARAGRFPRNRDYADRRMPYFVDASGTRCAMAHLIESTGERELVERVRTTRNNGFVRELAGDRALGRALGAWLGAAGLTVAEAARIQPEYCFVTKAQACFCNGTGSSDGVVIATATDQTLDGVLARVDTLHGNTGAIAVGQSIQVDASTGAHPGDALLVPVYFSQGMPMFTTPFRLDGDAVIVDNGCELDVPVLSKADAIAALLTTSTDGCSMYLADVNSTWGESQCDDSPPDDGGCAITSDGSPLAIGAALAAALWARRRPARATR